MTKTRELKLIWDFRGPQAHKTAEHHEIHLKEYIKLEKLNINIVGCESITDMHSIAYLVVKIVIFRMWKMILKN